MERIREKSIRMTEYIIQLCEILLAPLGFTLGSPRTPARRGSHVSLRHPEGYRLNRALIEEMNVIPDFANPITSASASRRSTRPSPRSGKAWSASIAR